MHNYTTTVTTLTLKPADDVVQCKGALVAEECDARVQLVNDRQIHIITEVG